MLQITYPLLSSLKGTASKQQFEVIPTTEQHVLQQLNHNNNSTIRTHEKEIYNSKFWLLHKHLGTPWPSESHLFQSCHKPICLVSVIFRAINIKQHSSLPRAIWLFILRKLGMILGLFFQALSVCVVNVLNWTFV